MIKSYLEMSREELLKELDSVMKEYDHLKAEGLNIDLHQAYHGTYQ